MTRMEVPPKAVFTCGCHGVPPVFERFLDCDHFFQVFDACRVSSHHGGEGPCLSAVRCACLVIAVAAARNKWQLQAAHWASSSACVAW